MMGFRHHDASWKYIWGWESPFCGQGLSRHLPLSWEHQHANVKGALHGLCKPCIKIWHLLLFSRCPNLHGRSMRGTQNPGRQCFVVAISTPSSPYQLPPDFHHHMQPATCFPTHRTDRTHESCHLEGRTQDKVGLIWKSMWETCCCLIVWILGWSLNQMPFQVLLYVSVFMHLLWIVEALSHYWLVASLDFPTYARLPETTTVHLGQHPKWRDLKEGLQSWQIWIGLHQFGNLSGTGDLVHRTCEMGCRVLARHGSNGIG